MFAWLILLFLLHARNAQIISSSGCHAVPLTASLPLLISFTIIMSYHYFSLPSEPLLLSFLQEDTPPLTPQPMSMLCPLSEIPKRQAPRFSPTSSNILLFPDWFSQCVVSVFTFHVIRRPCWCPPLYCIMLWYFNKYLWSLLLYASHCFRRKSNKQNT